MRGVILEGITGSGKTILLRALQNALVKTHRGPIWVATEHITERVLEPLKKADPREASAHLKSHLRQLGQMKRWDSIAPQGANTHSIYLLERFHLSCHLHIPEFSIVQSQDRLERRLATFKASLVWCWVAPEDILENCVRGPRQRRGEAWNTYVATLGDSEEALVRHFAEEQRRLEALMEQTNLPVTKVTVSMTNADQIAGKVAMELSL